MDGLGCAQRAAFDPCDTDASPDAVLDGRRFGLPKVPWLHADYEYCRPRSLTGRSAPAVVLCRGSLGPSNTPYPSTV